MGKGSEDLRQTYLYALRNEGEEGWQLAETQMNAVEVARHSSQEARATQHRFVGHRIRESSFDGFRLVDPPPVLVHFAQSGVDGWAYDPAIGRWRAPEEPLWIETGPNGSEAVENVFVQLSPPQDGWLPIAISAGGQRYAFEASQVYDPFPELVVWLRRIAMGEWPRLVIDFEDIYAILQCLPAEENGLRFVLIERDQTDSVKIDAIVDRARLVRSFYVPLVRLWESWTFRQRWNKDWDPDPGCVDHYPVRDLLSEQFLKEAGLEIGMRSSGPDEDIWNTLVSHRWVRVMCDFCADGVWNIRGASCPVEDLPVPAALRARITNWQKRYDEECDPPENPIGFDVEDFNAEGLMIARAVKAELPDWTVIYHDEAIDCSGKPREEWEYEVRLPRAPRSPDADQ